MWKSQIIVGHFQALDALGSTQWKINNVVLDVLEQMWKDGGRLADLVDAEDVRLQYLFSSRNYFVVFTMMLALLKRVLLCSESLIVPNDQTYGSNLETYPLSSFLACNI